MKLKIINFIILISLLIACKNADRVKDNPKEENKVVISEKTTTEKQVEECVFKREILLPKIRETIGDTITINHTNDWLLKLEATDRDEEIKRITNRGRKFFQINETENFITIGFLEDEGEYLGIYAYSISKENCAILGKELIAQTTEWENGYKEMFSIFHDDFTIKRQNQTGAKDWGDYTKWKRDTVLSILTFNEKGYINLKKK